MNYRIVEEGNYYHQNQNDWESDKMSDKMSDKTSDRGNDWGFFVVLDEEPIHPLKFNKSHKYSYCIPPKKMETIREGDFEDSCCLENGKDDQKKKEKAIIMQIYSGLTICALALYICLSS